MRQNFSLKNLIILFIFFSFSVVFIGLILPFTSLIKIQRFEAILGISFALIGYSMASTKIINQSNEALVERLGRYHRKLRPGLNFIVPLLDKIVVLKEVGREQILEITSIQVITKDNFPLEIDAVITWIIRDIEKNYYVVKDVDIALKNELISSLNEIIRGYTIDELFISFIEIDRLILDVLNDITLDWGIQTIRISIKGIRWAAPISGELPNTLNFIFHKGIDLKALNLSFEFAVENEGIELKVQSIVDKGNGVIVVNVKVIGSNITIVKEADLLNKIWSTYESLQEQNNFLVKSVSEAMMVLANRGNTYNNFDMKAIAGSQSMSEISKQEINNQNAQFGGGQVNAAESINAYEVGRTIGNQTPEQKQNLAQVAGEIKQILQKLEQINPTKTNTDKTIVAGKAADEIEKNPTLKARVIGALNSGSKETLKEAIDHPLVNILMATIEGWQNAK